VRAELQAKQCMGPQGNALAHERAPRRLGLMRFPYGACSPAALSEVAQQGLLPIQWDVSSGDPTVGLSALGIQQQVLSNVAPGSIVLFHANGRGWRTAGALPAVIAGLKARGYEFVTVSELLAAGEPVTSPSCYDSPPGGAGRGPLPARASGRCRPVAVPAPRAGRRRAVRICLALAERGAEALEKMAREWHVRGARSTPPPPRAPPPGPPTHRDRVI